MIDLRKSVAVPSAQIGGHTRDRLTGPTQTNRPGGRRIALHAEADYGASERRCGQNFYGCAILPTDKTDKRGFWRFCQFAGLAFAKFFCPFAPAHRTARHA